MVQRPLYQPTQSAARVRGDTGGERNLAVPIGLLEAPNELSLNRHDLRLFQLI